ncbi:saccharopine dehydrogenase [Fusarium langsethiae]|uniref:Saccharopine dehydrogenase n=1 Tax=Fusarium langsethiae TaxID=179993 RepID=A0A0M9F606_FUSLA|nr:saccharopine dehydrogenase [Fusarium langsethiae]
MEKFDIVLLGATRFTGRLCAAYMAQVLPETISWTIAGRSKTKLEELYKRIELKRTTCIVSTLDLTSEKAITELAKETRVVINTIDYVDCSGDPAWVRDMINNYDDIAQDTGSGAAVPADLSVYLSILKLRNRYSLPTREVLVCLEDVRGSFSGGSLSSVCSLEPVTMAPFDMPPVPRTDAEIAKHGIIPAPNIFGVQVVDGLGALVQSSHSQIETAIVGRSWGLYVEEGPYSLGPESYGANFFF